MCKTHIVRFSSPSALAKTKKRITGGVRCFVCSKPGPCKMFSELDTKLRTKLLQSVGECMRLNARAIPPECPREKFYLCSTCLVIMNKIRELHIRSEVIDREAIEKMMGFLEIQFLKGDFKFTGNWTRSLSRETQILRAMMKEEFDNRNIITNYLRSLQEQPYFAMGEVETKNHRNLNTLPTNNDALVKEEPRKIASTKQKRRIAEPVVLLRRICPTQLTPRTRYNLRKRCPRNKSHCCPFC